MGIVVTKPAANIGDPVYMCVVEMSSYRNQLPVYDILVIESTFLNETNMAQFWENNKDLLSMHDYGFNRQVMFFKRNARITEINPAVRNQEWFNDQSKQES